MFDVIQKVLAVTAAVKAGDYLTVVRLVGELLVLLGQPKQMFAAADGDADGLTAAVGELQACCDDADQPAGLEAFDAVTAAPAGAIDPATVLAIIQAALKVLDWWRNRR